MTPPAPTVTSPPTLNGNVTNPVSIQLSAAGGLPPYTWSLSSGTLPAGLTLSSAGRISGTPKQTGSSTFVVAATDSGTPSSAVALKSITMTVAPRKLTITTAALVAGRVGNAYSQSLRAIMGIAPLRWRILSGAALPPGLSLNTSTGRITGDPKQTGTSTFTVAVTDASTPKAMTATAKLSITVRPFVQAAVYVTQGGYNGVLSFGLSANGDASPLTSITGSATGLDATSGLAIDPTGRVYVADEDTPAISEYAYGSTGNVAPSSTIAGSATGLAVPTASGSNTGLDSPLGLTFDAAGHLWVANSASNSLTEYSASANGNATPLATISGAATGLDGPQGLTLDASNHLLVANTFGESLTEYATSASGDASPLRTISGAATGLSFPSGVDVDTVGNIYVANQFGGLTKYAADASGDAAPLATISGAATGLSTPEKVAVAPPLLVATQRLRRARVGHRYRFRLRAYLGTTPYHWKIIRGHLPPGIHLRRGGRLAGRPRHRGTYRFTVRVTDSTQPRMTARQRFTLRVRRR